MQMPHEICSSSQQPFERERELVSTIMLKSPTISALHSTLSPRGVQVTNRRTFTPSKPTASSTASSVVPLNESGGPRISRDCANVSWMLLLTACWIGCAISAYFAGDDGCPSNCNSLRRLAYGYDSQGRQCGAGRLAQYPFVHIAAPSHPLTSRICLPDCPSASLSLPTSLSLKNSPLLCVNADAIFEPVTTDSSHSLCISSSISCCYLSFPTTPLSKRCLPSLTSVAAAAANSSVSAVIFGSSSSFNAAIAFISNPQGSTSAILQQIGSNLPLLPAAVVSATLFSFCFCLFLRRAAAVAAVIILLLIFTFLSALSLFLWSQSTVLPSLPLPIPPISILSVESLPLTSVQCAAAAAVCTILTLAFAVVSISIFRRLLPAVVIIQLSAKVLWSAPRIVAVTACGSIIAAFSASAGIILILLLASAGGFDPMTMTFINTDSAEMRRCADAVSAAVKPATYTNVAVSRVCSFYSGDSTLAIASLPAVNSTSHLSSSVAGSTLSVQTFSYMMLGSAASVLWTLIWIGTVTTCITATTVSQWYWEGGGVGITIIRAIHEVFRHRLGSCALSSLLLALLLPILAFLQSIASGASKLLFCYRCCCQRKSESAKDNSSCLDLYRYCAPVASVLSSSAVIACSVMKLPLYAAAKRAHDLLRCHASQLVVVGATAGAIMSCGRVCVALLTAIASISFFYFRTFHGDVMPSWVIVNTTQGFPVATVSASAVIGYIVAAAVFNTLSITVDTLFMCVCDELESPRERVVMHRRLAALLQLHQTAASNAAKAKSPDPGKVLSPSKVNSCKNV